MLLLGACGKENDPKEHRGQFHGAEYEIYSSRDIGKEKRDSLKVLLERMEDAASRLKSNSLIRDFNSSQQGVRLLGKKGFHLKRCYRWAERIARISDKAFDPTVAPLVEYWGNDPDQMRTKAGVGSKELDSLKKLVGIQKVKLETRNGKGFLSKSVSEVQLDLSGVFKGYALDRIAKLFQEGRQDYLMMRIGNKYLIQGHPSKEDHWKVPIGFPNKSLKKEKVSWLHIKRDTAAVATSGNFQEFYSKNGRKYAYTIDPVSGQPAENRLLSVTVIAQSAALADGIATAYMVLGLKEAKRHASQMEELDAFFIGTDSDGEIMTTSTEGVSFSNKENSYRLSPN